MTRIASQTPEGTDNSAILVTIPDPNDYPDPLEFKLALAAGGCYQLPTGPDLASLKNPGSIAGKGWQFKSSRDPRLIRQWHEVDPNAGNGIHTGRSGLVVPDLDVDEIPDELAWLKSGLFQSSRGLLLDAGQSTARGHYVFASDEIFVSGKLKTADGTVVGEIRSGNTIILSQPSRHPKRDSKGGEYRWITTGLVPALPNEARNYLRPLANGENGTRNGSSESRSGTEDLASYLADRESSSAELFEWARSQFNDGSYEACCPAIRNAKDKWISAVITDEASYPNLSLGDWEILHLAAEGHTGWDAACGDLETVYYLVVADFRAKRLPCVALAEIERSYLDALRKIKGEVEAAEAIGAIYTPAECTCIRRIKNCRMRLPRRPGGPRKPRI